MKFAGKHYCADLTNRSKGCFLGFCTSAVIFAALGCEDRLPPEIIDQSVRPARVMTVSLSKSEQKIELVGRIEAARSVDLAFEVSGPLRAVPVLEGQEVTKGDVLAALDASDFLLAVKEAQVELRLAQQDLDRKARVLAERGIARSTVDDARSIRDLQKVRLSKAQEKLEDATLVAPFDGRIARRFVDGFSNVNAAQPILRLHAGNEHYVVVSVPERLSATLTQEDISSVYCTFSFSGKEKFPLTYRENSGEADGVAQTVKVSFAMQPSEVWNFLPGMTARVVVELKQSGISSVVIPSSAVVADEKQRLYVWLVDPQDHSVSRRYVQISQSQPAGVVVIEGLAQDDVIVTTGAANLIEGIRVRPMSDTERV